MKKKKILKKKFPSQKVKSNLYIKNTYKMKRKCMKIVGKAERKFRKIFRKNHHQC